MRAAIAFTLLLALAVPARAEAPRGLFEAYYDLLLADYCALVTPPVIAGYRVEAAAFIARDGLNDAAQQAVQSRAAIAFEKEWGNRGLGGSRPWCRHEGTEGAARLAAMAP